MARKRKAHPLVSVAWHESAGRKRTLVARWRDPDTKAPHKVSLTNLGFNSLNDAEKWLVDKSQELLAIRERASIGGRRKDVGTEWTKIAETYKEEFALEHSSDAAKRTDNWFVQPFIRWLKTRGVRRGDELSTSVLNAYRIFLRSETGRGLSPGACNRHLGAIKAFLSWSRRSYHRLSLEDIRDTLGNYKVDSRLPRVLGRKEILRLLAGAIKLDNKKCFAGRHDKAAYFKGKPSLFASSKYEPLGSYLLLSLLTGARPGEVLGLKWEDWHPERSVLEVWGSKTRRQRAIPLSDSPLLAALLRALHLKRNGQKHILGDNETGGPRVIRRTSWNRLVKRARIMPAAPKVLRSTCVAHVASASPDSEFLLEARFGHGAEISKRHYRQPLHGLRERGSTVEEWLGCAAEIKKAMAKLGLPVPEQKVMSNTPPQRIAIHA